MSGGIPPGEPHNKGRQKERAVLVDCLYKTGPPGASPAFPLTRQEPVLASRALARIRLMSRVQKA